jgi:3-oxoacyl-[acyl-carrier protein] reductase
MCEIAVVTGANGDIGQAIVNTLRENHYTVVPVLHYSPDESFYDIEMQDVDDIQYTIRDICERMGGIDVWVNAAGIIKRQPYNEVTKDDWNWQLDTNLRGTFFCCQEVMRIMKAQGSGQIVNIASSGGQLGGTLAIPYAISKAGIIALTKSFARVGAPSVRVNCVSPGLIEGKMSSTEINSKRGQKKIKRDILLGRTGTPQEVAQTVVSVLGNTYMTGQTINVNGGLYLG